MTTIDNLGGTAAGFQYYGLSGNTSVQWQFAGAAVGTIYGPEANVTLSGGASVLDFSGSLVANSVNLLGHINLHYDENLTRIGPQR